MMKKILIALLSLAFMLGGVSVAQAIGPGQTADVAPPGGSQVSVCWGAHGNVCIGEDRNGVGFIRLGNAYGAVYVWVEPTATFNTADRTGGTQGGAQLVGAADSHSVNVLRYAHSRNIETGLSDLQVRNLDIAFTTSHGRTMAVAHECHIVGGNPSGGTTWQCP
jgi:hypothetical protein